jgi:hypothetical protein
LLALLVRFDRLLDAPFGEELALRVPFRDEAAFVRDEAAFVRVVLVVVAILISPLVEIARRLVRRRATEPRRHGR